MSAKASKPLSRKEKQDLLDSIANAKQQLAVDKAQRPKRQLTAKQLENLRRGREMNPRFHPKNGKKDSKASKTK